jgi:hypothetical protein
MNPLIVLRVGYMERYDGPGIITGGGGYVLENGVGGEVFNFKPSRGKCYGYAMSTKFAGLDLNKVDTSRDWLPGDELSGVDVVFIARKPTVGQVVVGWYRNATIFHKQYRTRYGSIAGMVEMRRHFMCWAPSDSVHLLSDGQRTFVVPSAPAGNHGFPGQSNVWYPSQNFDDVGVRGFTRRLRRYLDKASSVPLSSDEAGVTKGGGAGRRPIPDQAHNAKVEAAAVRVVGKYYESLGYTVKSVESENLGWDLHARKRNKTLYIEVKGVSDSSIYFELTPNEYKRLKEHYTYFRVCVVCDALTRPKLYELTPEKLPAMWRLVSADKKVVVPLQERIAAIGTEVM